MSCSSFASSISVLSLRIATTLSTARWRAITDALPKAVLTPRTVSLGAAGRCGAPYTSQKRKKCKVRGCKSNCTHATRAYRCGLAFHVIFQGAFGCWLGIHSRSAASAMLDDPALAPTFFATYKYSRFSNIPSTRRTPRAGGALWC
jgi:hypothetical protein